MQGLIYKNGVRTALVFGAYEADYLQGEQKSFRDIYRKTIEKFYREYSLASAVTVTETFKDTFRRIIGNAEGRSNREIADYVRQEAKLQRYQAERIARTEAHTASQAGSRASAEATGLTLVKVWLSAEGQRTRPAHARADGQRRKMNQKYLVGGERIVGPGDPKASASNRINCRCQEVYEPA
jgi:hypothetical protein